MGHKALAISKRLCYTLQYKHLFAYEDEVLCPGERQIPNIKWQTKRCAKMKCKERMVKVICNNCFRSEYGVRDATGLIKFQCPYCGTVSVSKAMSRRHVQIDIYAPKGQTLIDEEP